jgi:hypothetical protein
VFKLCRRINPDFTFEKVSRAMSRLVVKEGMIRKEQFEMLLIELQKKTRVGKAVADAIPNGAEMLNYPAETTLDCRALKKEASSQNLKLTRISGCTDSTQHSIDEDEVEQYANHISSIIRQDKLLSKRYPISSESLFDRCKDGLLIRYSYHLPSLMH